MELFFNAMRSTPAAGWNVKLSVLRSLQGIGNFMLRDKPPHPGRNPQTGEVVPIAARRAVTFRASHLLKEACLAGGNRAAVGEENN